MTTMTTTTMMTRMTMRSSILVHVLMCSACMTPVIEHDANVTDSQESHDASVPTDSQESHDTSTLTDSQESHDAATPTDSQESLDAFACPGACMYASGAYYWRAGCDPLAPSLRCGDSCDPLMGCPDASVSGGVP